MGCVLLLLQEKYLPRRVGSAYYPTTTKAAESAVTVSREHSHLTLKADQVRVVEVPESACGELDYSSRQRGHYLVDRRGVHLQVFNQLGFSPKRAIGTH